MHYLYSRDIYFSTTYNLSVYDITYDTLYHTHPEIVTAAEKGEYIQTKIYMKLERNSSLTLSCTHPETLLETHIVDMEIILSLRI